MNSLFVLFLAGLVSVGADSGHPIERIVKLIGDLKAKVLADGKAEQESFDAYACWCEKTLERKASDISASKELIAETEILIKKLEGQIGSHGAEIAQLNKDIASNIQSQKDAEEVRTKDHNEYSSERSESEQCIGALEFAIGTLTGAGTKKGFLETSTHTAQLMSVISQVRTVFAMKPHAVSEKDMDLVKGFLSKPEDFFGAHAKAQIKSSNNDNNNDNDDNDDDAPHKKKLALVSQNPFGDYAPQSTQIQGILKGMYDSFTADLEKENAQEAESQKSFEALSATKKEEQATLEATLQKQETDKADKTKRLNEAQVLKDNTADQLAADEAFFADSKAACQAKASEWSVRTRLRTEEISGMNQAMQILSTDDAKKTFKASANTFVQVSIEKHVQVKADASKAYAKLRKMATEYKSVSLARIAAFVQMGGHFDKVIVMIDDMVTILRKEEADDIVHRDMCEGQQNANKNEMDDLEHSLKKVEEMLKRLGNTKNELGGEIEKLENDIDGTKASQAELLKFRNEEEVEFRQALKDDTDAVALIKQAVAALSKYMRNNKVPLELVQKGAPEDADKPPSADFASADKHSNESGGILAILSMLTEDLEKEIAEGRADDADAKAKYLKQNGALQDTLDAQEETKVSVEEELAGTDEKIDAAEQLQKGKTDDKSAEQDTKKALATDCAWVKSHFDDRRQKRKDEMQGLVDAKAFLAGVEAGNEPLPPIGLN